MPAVTHADILADSCGGGGLRGLYGIHYVSVKENIKKPSQSAVSDIEKIIDDDEANLSKIFSSPLQKMRSMGSGKFII